MVTLEQAKAYIEKHPKTTIATVAQLDGFTQPYRTLGLLVSGEYRKEYGSSPAIVELLRQQFGSDTVNPWETKEGKRLATTLFGQVIGPFVADMWEMMDRLPYQSGFARRPFRLNGSNYPELKISLLTGLYYTGQTGYNAMTIEDQILYSVYQPNNQAGLFLSLALNRWPERYFQLLEEIFLGEHEIGGVSTELIKALLLTDREEFHLLVEKLLLAAQQQEGLRQSILESLDFTSVTALRRFIDVILEHNLTRFSSVVRAVDVWFGFRWDAPKAATVRRALELARKYLDHGGTANEALQTQDNLEWYVFLWATGIEDVDAATKWALDVVYDERIEKIKKLVSLFFVHETRRTRHQIVDYAKREMGNDIELDYWLTLNFPDFEMTDDLFDRFVQDAKLLPKQGKTFEGRGFEWKSYTITPEHFYDKAIYYGKERHLIALAEELSALPSRTRETLLKAVFPHHYTNIWEYPYGSKRETKRLELAEDAWQRRVVRKAIIDRNNTVSATGQRLFWAMDLYAADIEILEQLLARKGKELRKVSIELLLDQPDHVLRHSLERLIASANLDQRLAALEMLTVLHENGRMPSEVTRFAEQYRSREISANERVLLDKLSTKEEVAWSFANGFGAIDYANLTDFDLPKNRFERKKGLASWFSGSTFLFKDLIDTQKTSHAINQLIELFEQHKDFEYQFEGYEGETVTALLGNTLAYLKAGHHNKTPQEKLENLPLAHIWQQWYRSCGLNDFELYTVAHYFRRQYPKVRLSDAAKRFTALYLPEFPGIKVEGVTNFYQSTAEKVMRILEHLLDAHGDKRLWASFRLDVLEDALHHFPQQLKTESPYAEQYYYGDAHWTGWVMSLLYNISEGDESDLDDEQCLRLWKLQWYLLAQCINRPEEARSVGEVLPRIGNALDPGRPWELPVPSISLSLRLYQRRLIGKDDVLLLSLLNDDLFSLLEGSLKYRSLDLPDAEVQGINRQLKENLLRLELGRGDLPTEASRYIYNMNHIEGMGFFFEALSRLGDDTFEKGYTYDTTSKRFTFSRVLKRVVPAEDESYEDFAARIRGSGLQKKRLVEVACYATQWADWIGDYLKINKLREAVWWFIAHTTDYMDAEKETVIARYSNVPRNDFQKGAIDIDWFHRVYATLGKANWKLVHEAAKYLSDGLGYRRVKLYSSVLLGETKVTEAWQKIMEKRDKDYVMALGLIPISKANPEADLLKRYDLLQDFLKQSRQFGAQRQESERNAVAIGMDNLARNAGYDDRIRFSWAMESKATQAIMENSPVTIDDVEVALIVDDQGKADLRVSKKGKEQKSIPAKYRKDGRIASLQEAKSYLVQQYGRTRASLEQAMVRQDPFKGWELNNLMSHPVVQAMLSKLVLFLPEAEQFGFWEKGNLRGADASLHPIREDDVVLIAHPSHLYAAVQWDLYQKFVFDNAIQQPFKQVFRELYLPTADELERSNRSERYQGHQVQPNKAVALLRSRGWTVSYQEGLQKVYHKEGYLATLFSMADWFSPSDVESPTLEYVCFFSLRSGEPMPLSEIDPVVFSEVMRDVDLVVSVAHVGEVDPEASHSTMEMRGVLARESARLFKLDNVEVKSRHILVKGKLAEYNIHLGSGMVSKNGLQLSIIPVHSQHRGRVFLPFVDDDPKSAEIISKMLLLAKDDTIKDPTILQQIHGS